MSDAFTDEAACAERDFQTFLSLQRPALVARARGLCRGRHADAEDLVQDALERAWRARTNVREHGASRAWLHSILANLFIDRARWRKRQPAPHPIDVHELPAPYDDEQEDAPWAALSVADLHSAVAALPDDVREVYRLHAFEGLDYHTIARALGLPRGTIATRLLRARRRLRALLAPATA